jgi:hypothetical protein
MALLVLADKRNPGCVLVERSRAATRVRARVRAHALDRELAEGAPPDSSAGLELRAHDLIGSRARLDLALGIRRLLDEAGHPLRPLSFSVPICRRKVRRSSSTLEALADRLVADEPLDARGLAQLRLLLRDGGGPVYLMPAADDLEPALERVMAALKVPAERS